MEIELLYLWKPSSEVVRMEGNVGEGDEWHQCSNVGEGDEQQTRTSSVEAPVQLLHDQAALVRETSGRRRPPRRRVWWTNG